MLKRSFYSSRFLLKKLHFKLADIGEGITECEVIQWFVKQGDKVEQFTPICEVQSDKAAVEISSRYDGIISKLHYQVGDVAKVGSPLVDIETLEDDQDQDSKIKPPIASIDTLKAADSSADAPKSSNVNNISEALKALTFATPAVRRIAKEHNIDLSKVTPSGPNGRILKGDVLNFIAHPSKEKVESTATTELQPLTTIQKAMFKSMTNSLQIPHFGYSDEIVLDATSQYRDSLNSHLNGTGKKISYMPIFVKALSCALKEYPILNSCIVEQDNVPKIQFRSAHNIGIAMDTPQGLIVPNIKNVEQKSILQIANDLERLRDLGKKGQLAPADLKDGTLTLSNIGNIGGTLLHPVMVTSQVCIGAIGKIQRLPRFETIIENGIEKEIVVGKQILNASFNADHRVIDGATLARFVSLWKNYLENPALMSANLK